MNTVELLNANIGMNVTFNYSDKDRNIQIEKVAVCKNGNTILTGLDQSNAYKSFNVNKMMNVKLA